MRTDRFYPIFLVGLILFCFAAQAQMKPNKYSDKLKTYNLPKNKMYRGSWIDLNKNGKMDVYEDKNAPIEKRIDNLISQMTLDEKTCQMVTLYGYKRVLEDDLPNPSWKNKIWKDGMGAIDEHLNGFYQWGMPPSDNPYVWPASKHAWALNEVQRFFIEETRLGIPVDFTNEGIRGVESFKATNFPTQLALGTTWNRDLIEKVGYITGNEARLLGYTNVYAPILDVGRDQRWGRYEEVYGECPFLVAELGVKMTKGLQTNYQVAATAKHYVAYSNNKGAREGYARVDPQMSPREVENIHLYPWKRVIKDAGLLGVMSSYNDYDGFPVQSSSFWLDYTLRKLFGFKGYVVSDSDAVEYLFMKHHTADDMKESVYQSVMAGLNVRCTFRSPDGYVLPLRELVQEGKIDMKTIDERVRDILRVKFMVGAFDQPYQMDFVKADKVVNSAENQLVALQAAHESIVLLKNKNNFLPLDKTKIKRIAVCGPNANNSLYALTHYGPLAVEVKTVFQGIVDKVGKDIQVNYTHGCDLVDPNWPDSEIMSYPLTDAEKAEIKTTVDDVKKSDVAVVVLGDNIRTCGENRSRSSLELPGRQLDLLKAVYATGKPVVLILINGRPASINWADRNVDAILETCYPGSQGGIAIADALFGDYNPGGKLTVTFPKTVGQIPFNFPFKPASQVDGGIQTGMTGNQTRINGALYNFGYGLSYTTFEYSDLRLSASEIKPNENVEVSFKVTNTGKRAGDEVVQMYTRDVLSTLTTYEKNLRGFERVNLQPGETKEVKFTIIPEYLQLYNAENKWVVEPGDFNVMIGASSEDIRLKSSFTVTDEQGNNPTKNKKKNTLIDPVCRENDFMIFNIPNPERTKRVEITWGTDTDPNAPYEVQFSRGGGQFFDFKKAVVLDKNIATTIELDGMVVSDIKIIAKDKKVCIKNIEFY